MTLLETIRLIEEVAAAQPSVKMIVENDVFKLNGCPDALYGVFAFVQGQHTGVTDTDMITYNFSLFYVDRLKADKSNLLEVQSVGVQTLTNILHCLDERGVYCDSYTMQVFNQRFTDECAGVFCNVALQVLDTPCGEEFTTDNSIKII